MRIRVIEAKTEDNRKLVSLQHRSGEMVIQHVYLERLKAPELEADQAEEEESERSLGQETPVVRIQGR